MSNLIIFLFFVLILYIYNSFQKLKIDNNHAAFYINKINFSKVHPNLITFYGIILGIILNIIVFKNYKINNYLLIIILYIRYLTDILDGAIARKYNKTSKIGNKLDCISDIIFAHILFYIILSSLFNLDYKLILPLYIILMIFFDIIFDFKNSHNNLKQSGLLYENITSFSINNSYLFFILFYLLF